MLSERGRGVKRLIFGRFVFGLALRADHSRASAKPGPAPSAKQVKSSDAERVVAELATKIEKLGAKLGASVISIEDGTELGSHDGARPINPASNAKIPTATAALLLLGPQHRFATGLFGNVENGVVSELVLRGRGDPGFSTADLRDLVRELRTRGVSKVEKILVDQGAFSEWLPPAFEQQPNEWAPFRAPVAAVSLNRNVVSLFVRPADKEKDLAVVIADPPGFVDFEGQIRTAGRDAPERLIADLSAKGDHLTAKLGGVVPLGKAGADHPSRNRPRSLAGSALRACCASKGKRWRRHPRRAVEEKPASPACLATGGSSWSAASERPRNSPRRFCSWRFPQRPGGATFAPPGLVEGVLPMQCTRQRTVIKNGSIVRRSLGPEPHRAARYGDGSRAIAPELVSSSPSRRDGTLKNRLTRSPRSGSFVPEGTLASVTQRNLAIAREERHRRSRSRLGRWRQGRRRPSESDAAVASSRQVAK